MVESIQIIETDNEYLMAHILIDISFLHYTEPKEDLVHNNIPCVFNQNKEKY